MGLSCTNKPLPPQLLPLPLLLPLLLLSLPD
jgi:hypothetical protein